MIMENLKYPINRFTLKNEPDETERKSLISSIQIFPENLLKTICDLTEIQLDIPYRPGGWTVRQVVHHLADSHINGYICFKLALTENTPEIKIYDQDAWVQTTD
jgi:hypothetical protein